MLVSRCVNLCMLLSFNYSCLVLIGSLAFERLDEDFGELLWTCDVGGDSILVKMVK